MDKMNWGAAFSDIVEQNKTCLYEICKFCMELLEEHAETAEEGFRYFLTQVPVPRYEANEIPEGFFDVDDGEIDRDAQKRIREMENQLVKELIFREVTEEEFYAEMWRRIRDTLLVSNLYQRAFFLFRMWMDPRVPYYDLGIGVKMDNEAYRSCVQQIDPSYRQMLFAMNAGYPQKTQKASVVMDIADKLQNREQRIVFWAVTLGRLEKQIVDLKKRVRELEVRQIPDDGTQTE